MKIWKSLSIYTSEGSRLGTRPLHTALVATALDQGLHNATVFKSTAGFGPQMAIPAANSMALESDLPLEIRIIDEPDRINAFLSSQKDILGNCIVVLKDVEIFWAPGS
jgi:PII-like signaling protein